MKITNRTVYQNWQAIGFTALPPGWINVYINRDGTYETEPCPGVLIQECTSRTVFWDEEYEDEDGRVKARDRDEECERETRAVCACAPYDATPALEAADTEGRAWTYYATVTVEEFASWPAPKRDEQAS